MKVARYGLLAERMFSSVLLLSVLAAAPVLAVFAAMLTLVVSAGVTVILFSVVFLVTFSSEAGVLLVSAGVWLADSWLSVVFPVLLSAAGLLAVAVVPEEALELLLLPTAGLPEVLPVDEEAWSVSFAAELPDVLLAEAEPEEALEPLLPAAGLLAVAVPPEEDLELSAAGLLTVAVPSEEDVELLPAAGLFTVPFADAEPVLAEEAPAVLPVPVLLKDVLLELPPVSVPRKDAVLESLSVSVLLMGKGLPLLFAGILPDV